MEPQGPRTTGWGVARVRVTHQRLSTLAWVLIGFLGIVVVWQSWLSDDAFITFRTVRHFLEGRGLVWNPGERVQAYTHPLWMLLVSAGAFVTGSIPTTALMLSWGASVAAALGLARQASGSGGAVLGLGLLLLSSSFLAFSTSGLENPLSHLLLVAFVASIPRVGAAGSADGTYTRAVGRVVLLTALLALTRMDLGLLVLPGLILVLGWGRGWRRVGPVLAGLAPLMAWEAFSIVYYGFPFPNTAYAKLGAGFPRAELLAQGLDYVLDLARRDPVTLAVVGLGPIVAGWAGGRRAFLVAAGAWPYAAYLVWIGGDFMTGRLWTPPFVLVVAVLAGAWGTSGRSLRAPAWLGAVVLVAGMAALPHWTRPSTRMCPAGIIDERGFYGSAFRHHERLDARALAERDAAVRMAESDPGKVLVIGAVGRVGFHRDDAMPILDYHALGDPFLARMPAISRDSLFTDFCRTEGDVECRRGWRPGHFRRALPAGYLASVATGRNLLEDPALAALLDSVRQVTRGPLFSGDRWRAILRLNGMRRSADVLGAAAQAPTSLDESFAALVASHPELAGSGMARQACRLRILQHRWDEAVSACRLSLRIRHEGVEVADAWGQFNDLGYALFHSGAPEEARRMLLRAVETGEALPFVYQHVRKVYEALDDREGYQAWLTERAELGDRTARSLLEAPPATP